MPLPWGRLVLLPPRGLPKASASELVSTDPGPPPSQTVKPHWPRTVLLNHPQALPPPAETLPFTLSLTLIRH